jgi:hypothetical protein
MWVVVPIAIWFWSRSAGRPGRTAARTKPWNGGRDRLGVAVDEGRRRGETGGRAVRWRRWRRSDAVAASFMERWAT